MEQAQSNWVARATGLPRTASTAGIALSKRCYGQLQSRYGDEHRAEHTLMEALGEELWTAQRDGRAPDEGQYLALARKRLA